MNACVEAIYLHATANGMEVWAGQNGFDGLIDDDFVRLTPSNAVGISHKSGCVFGCNRSSRLTTTKAFAQALTNVKKNDFDAVIVLGGNGSLIGSGRFKNAGVKVIFVPSTIDNDVPGYKNALGFSSACESSVKAIDAIRVTMETSQRDHIVQLMGRHCNELALRVGAATFADIIDMEGARVTPTDVAKVFMANRAAGKKSNMLLMQERRGKNNCEERANDAKFLADISKAAGSDNVRMSVLGYLQRGADPSCQDRFLAVSYGKAAVDLIARKQFGTGVSMINDQVHVLNIELAPVP